jgi:hypothetical protein
MPEATIIQARHTPPNTSLIDGFNAVPIVAFATSPKAPNLTLSSRN